MWACVGVAMMMVGVWGSLVPIPAPSIRTQAEDCVQYSDSNPPQLYGFWDHVALEVTPKPDGSGPGILVLSSPSSETACNIFLISRQVAVSCGVGKEGKMQSLTQMWSMEVLAQNEMTEIWLQVGGGGGGTHEVKSSDGGGGGGGLGEGELHMVVRRRGQLIPIVMHSSGLLPPLTLDVQGVIYYYNCITGCHYGVSTITQPGNHVVYLRPDLNFQHLQLTYHANIGTVTLNVTSDDLVMEEGSREGKRVREVKVLWDANNNTIVAQVDGVIVGDGEVKVGEMDSGKAVEAEVVGGGGLVAPCDVPPIGKWPRTDEGDDEATSTATTTTNTPTSTLSVPIVITQGPTMTISSPACTSAGMVVALGFLLPLLVLLFITTVFLAVLYYRASKKVRILTGDGVAGASVGVWKRGSSKRSVGNGSSGGSKRGSNHSGVGGSFRKRGGEAVPSSERLGEGDDDHYHQGDDQGDCGSASEVTAALSDTVTTPTQTPGSLGVRRPSKIVSSKEFVGLELM